jgi:hypothetical protein
MTKFLAITAVAALAFVGGCNKSTKTSDMGAMNNAKCSEKTECCASKKDGAMGTVGEKGDCASKCAEKKANMGAMTEKKDCASKASCSDKKDASMGTVADKAECTSKKSCSDKQ